MLILTYPKDFGDSRNLVAPFLTAEGTAEGSKYKVTRISPYEGHIEISIMVPKWELEIRDFRKGDET